MKSGYYYQVLCDSNDMTNPILGQIIDKYEIEVPDKQIEDPFQIIYENSEVITKETKESDMKKQQIPDNEKRSEAFDKRSDKGCEVPSDQAMNSEGLVTFSVSSC